MVVEFDEQDNWHLNFLKNWLSFFCLGFFTEPVETSQMAENAPDTNIFFVPGFNGLQAPINDPSATAGFIGKINLLRGIDNCSGAW